MAHRTALILSLFRTEVYAQGGDSTASYPGCVGSNWREIGPFWTWREGVLLYWCILEGLHLYGCVYRELTPIWVYF